jgi:hypothetical protein
MAAVGALFMRRSLLPVCLLWPVITAAAAYADHGPNIVIPGRPDVPIIIDGVYASWGVAVSDWGLYRPGAVPVTIIPGPYPPPPYRKARPYFPSLGGKPYSGRYDIEPPADRQLPKPAEAYHRSWSAESPDVPPTQYAPSPPMMIAPEVNVDPYRDERRDRPDFPRRRR